MEKAELDKILEEYFEKLQEILKIEKAKIFEKRGKEVRRASSRERALCGIKSYCDIYLLPRFNNEVKQEIYYGIAKLIKTLKHLGIGCPDPPEEIMHLFSSGNLSTLAKKTD